VCIGHTHRAGIVPHTEAYGGKVTRTVYGMEVGCLMDMGKAGYLKSGGANWQLASASTSSTASTSPRTWSTCARTGPSPGTA
jgi:hypothetical protein